MLAFDLINFNNLTAYISLLCCLFLGSFYVLSLYLWSSQHRFNRNTSNVIVRRFISVILSCVVSFLFICFISQSSSTSSSLQQQNDWTTIASHSIFKWIGLKFDVRLLLAVVISLSLTMILFAGPIVQYLIASYLSTLNQRRYLQEIRLMHQQSFRIRQEPDDAVQDQSTASTAATATAAAAVGEEFVIEYSYMEHLRELCARKLFNWTELKQNLADLFFWRNYVISPFTEEFVFRSCMLPLLVPHFSHLICILITPLFFGLAHLHHIFEGYKVKNLPFSVLLMHHSFQFVYTYVFGVYSSFLFIRTGNMFSSFVSHSFCNLMGFPNINELLHDFDDNRRLQQLIIVAYVIGFLLFFILLSPATTPALFANSVYYNLTSTI